MLPDIQADGAIGAGARRTLAKAYLGDAAACEKAISHHFRQRQPEELIELVPELNEEVAAVVGEQAGHRTS